MKSLLAIFLLVQLLFPASLKAETPLDMAAEAQGALDRQEYAQAVKIYQDLLNLGYINGNIYYNLSQAYWQMGQAGQALRYLLQAQRWKPRSQAIYNNLLYVKNQLNLNDAPANSWRQWFDEYLFRPLSLNYYEKLSLLALFSLGFFGPLIRAKLKKRPIKKRWVLPLGFLWGLTLLVFAQATYVQFGVKTAVVIQAQTPLLDAPTQEASTLKILAEGAEFPVQKKQGEFQLVKTPQGERGWVESSRLGRIQ